MSQRKRHMPPSLRAMLALSLAVACKRTPPPAAEVTREPAPVAAPAAAPAATATAPPAVDAAPAAPAAEVDLLRETEASVSVSSVVANATDRPANLVDGDPATVWSSRTGEMERTWIRARVPADAEVRGIEMTAGYTRGPAAPDAGRDLFTANVRVARVRVLHDGAAVGEFPLDVASRAMQRIPVRGSGGEWRVETVGLAPGTERSWREVSVSELRVLGVPGATGRRAAPAAPTVAVGDAPAAAAAGPAGDGGVANTSGAIAEALREARRSLLGEGLRPREGEYGCSGSYADICVRSAWAAIADAGVAHAEARCGAAVAAPVAAYRRQRAALETLQRRSGEQAGTDEAESLNPAADTALERAVEGAGAVFAACASAPSLARLGTLLGDREPDALRPFRWRE